MGVGEGIVGPSPALGGMLDDPAAAGALAAKLGLCDNVQQAAVNAAKFLRWALKGGLVWSEFSLNPGVAAGGEGMLMASDRLFCRVRLTTSHAWCCLTNYSCPFRPSSGLAADMLVMPTCLVA